MQQSTHSFAILCVLVLGLTGCAANVVTDYDSQAPFAAYSTYTFAPDESEGVQSLDESRVRAAVTEAMEKEGLEKVASDQADLWVRFRFEEQRKYESTGFTYGLGLFNSPFGFGLSTRPEAKPINQQKLVLELVEPTDRRVVWQGTSREYLTETMPPQSRAELIEELVANMFDRYPPGAP